MLVASAVSPRSTRQTEPRIEIAESIVVVQDLYPGSAQGVLTPQHSVFIEQKGELDLQLSAPVRMSPIVIAGLTNA